jgi:hypothetical protein
MPNTPVTASIAARIPHHAENRLGARPHPRLAARFFDPCDVAELALGRVFGVFARHSRGDERLGFLGQMLANFLLQIVINAIPREEVAAANP